MSRPVAVLLHGFGADRLAWDENVGALAALTDVVAPDLPGHGEAGVEEGPGLAALLGWLERAVEENAPGRHVAFFGHSLGGGLALAWAERHPERTAGLFLIAPVGLGRGISRGFLRGFSVLSESPAAREAFGKLVASPARAADATVARALRRLDTPAARAALLAMADALADEEPRYRACAAAVAARGLPRTLVWGERDRINRFDAHDADAFGGALHLVPGAGHVPHMERPGVVTPLMTAFYRSVAGISRS